MICCLVQLQAWYRLYVVIIQPTCNFLHVVVVLRKSAVFGSKDHGSHSIEERGDTLLLYKPMHIR